MTPGVSHPTTLKDGGRDLCRDTRKVFSSYLRDYEVIPSLYLCLWRLESIHSAVLDCEVCPSLSPRPAEAGEHAQLFPGLSVFLASLYPSVEWEDWTGLVRIFA